MLYSLSWIYHNFTFSLFKCRLLNKLFWCHIALSVPKSIPLSAYLRVIVLFTLRLSVYECGPSIILYRRAFLLVLVDSVFSFSNLNIRKQHETKFWISNSKRPPGLGRSILVLKTFCFAQFGKLSQFIREKSVWVCVFFCCFHCSLTVCPFSLAKIRSDLSVLQLSAPYPQIIQKSPIYSFKNT